MKLHIDYHARYCYEEPVSLSPHLVRIFPRRDQFLQVANLKFSSNESADIKFRRDLFDNEIAHCFYPDPIQDLDFYLQAELDITERNPFGFLLAGSALNIPVKYSDLEKEILAPYLRPHEACELPDPLRPAGERPTVETLVNFNSWIYEQLGYERRDEGDPFLPSETLSRGQGSCRDFGVLLAEVLRQNGIATRLASGFLWEGEKEEGKPKVAESAMHAWVESYLPGAGWLAMDPTNGSFTDHSAITTAAGLYHENIAPVSGHYYGKKTIPSHLETKLEVKLIE